MSQNYSFPPSKGLGETKLVSSSLAAQAPPPEAPVGKAASPAGGGPGGGALAWPTADVPLSEGQRVRADLLQSCLERKPVWLFGKQSSNKHLKPKKVFIFWSIN